MESKGMTPQGKPQVGDMVETYNYRKEFMGKGIFDRNWISVLQVGTMYQQNSDI